MKSPKLPLLVHMVTNALEATPRDERGFPRAMVDARDFAIVAVGLGAALRQSEIARLRVRDVSVWPNRIAVVVTRDKGTANALCAIVARRVFPSATRS